MACDTKESVKILNSTTESTEKNEIYKFKPLHILKCDYSSCSTMPDCRLVDICYVTATESHLYYLCNIEHNHFEEIGLFVFDPYLYTAHQQLRSYNFATKRWKSLEITDSIKPADLDSKNIFIIPGYENDFRMYTFFSDIYYMYTTGEKPQAIFFYTEGDVPTLYGPASIVHNNYLYTIGGRTNINCTCDVYRLNLKNKIWENVYKCCSNIPKDRRDRYRHGIAYDGNYIYVLDIGDTNILHKLQRISVFNLNTNQWEYIDTIPDQTALTDSDNAGFPTPRNYFCCVQHKASNGHIEVFITGGFDKDIKRLDDIWKLDLQTKQWSKIHFASLPSSFYTHFTVHANNGCMYLLKNIGKTKLHTTDLYKMWMTIPKLSEICWDAITFYNDNLCRNTLLNLGIPQHFVNRLPINEN